MRSTVDIAAPILAELNRIKDRDGVALSELVNDLLAEGLKQRCLQEAPPEVEWFSQRIRARVDLTDKGAVRALDDMAHR